MELKSILQEPESRQYINEVPDTANNLNNIWLHLEGGYRKMYRDIKKVNQTKAKTIWEHTFPIWIHVDRYVSETGLDDESIVARMSKSVPEGERTKILESLLPLYCYLRHEGFTKEQITA